LKTIILSALLLTAGSPAISQTVKNNLKLSYNQKREQHAFFNDSLNKGLKRSKSISALFLSAGGGISVPLSPFKTSSDVTFGILGRLEFSSYGIFPFVIGGEVTYFSYGGADEFKTVNLLTNFKTTILSYGLNIEYSLAKILRSSFTMPFLTVDVKNNMIKREYDDARNFDDLPREETKVGVGAGFGFTLFIFDFYAKYNYMKNNSHIGVYTKTKIPVIRF
jgi:hypothetical protein